MNNPEHEKTDSLCLDTFQDRLDEQFAVQLDGQTVNLVLAEATALPPATTRTDLGIRQDPFSLIFKSREGIDLPQQTYEVQHESIGPIQMFLVPVGFGECQAIFN